MTLGDIGKKIVGAAPLLAGLITGPAGPAVTAGLTLLAHGLGVTPDAPAIDQALAADPLALEKLKALEAQNAVQLQALTVQAAGNQLAADTSRIQAVNATMQAEVAGHRGWWRELFGYVSALMFGLEVGAVVYVMLFSPGESAGAVALVSALTMLWGVPMAVLGIAAWHDGATQRIKAGDTSLSAALAAKWGGDAAA